MKLTYSVGHFTFSTTDFKQTREIIKSEDWKEKSLGVFKTSNLKAARCYWQYADDDARKILNRAFVTRYERPTAPLPSFLDPHQMEGVMWILTRSRSYLAHAPGAGKTCEAIVASFLADGDGTTLFIVPPALTVNWTREIAHFTELMEEHGYTIPRAPIIAVIPESKDQVLMDWSAPFIICPDSMLAREWVLRGLNRVCKKFIAVDEASRFKDADAQRSIALFGGTFKTGKKTTGLVYKARHTVLLDGSPMPNRPIELWAPTYAMSPESIDFATYSEFGFKYCGAKINDRGNWEYKYSSNEEELKARLQESFMHVVTEEELSHPERRRSLLFMNEDPRNAAMKKWEKENIHKINLDDIGENVGNADLATYRHEIGLRKCEWVVDYVSSRIKEKNESILLFAWHRDVCEYLKTKLFHFNAKLIYGGTSKEETEHHFKNFQAGKLKLIVGNIAAMGRGHNLQRADRVVFAEYSWNDELNKQCEKRASRRGSDKEYVRCDYVVAPYSLDEIILKSVMRKIATVKKVIG